MSIRTCALTAAVFGFLFPITSVADERPLEDYLSQQGQREIDGTLVDSFFFDDANMDGACERGSDGICGEESPEFGFRNMVGWADTNFEINFSLVDYAGLSAGDLLSQFGVDLGTEVTGTVTETPILVDEMPTGKAVVRIQTQTINALGFIQAVPDIVACFNAGGSDCFGGTPSFFGQRATDVVSAGRAKEAALGVVYFDVSLVIEEGGDIPDLVCALGNYALPSCDPCNFVHEDADFTFNIAGSFPGSDQDKEDRDMLYTLSQVARLSKERCDAGEGFNFFALETVEVVDVSRDGNNGKGAAKNNLK